VAQKALESTVTNETRFQQAERTFRPVQRGRFMAALRELTEKTGLLPYAAEIIFKYKGKISPTMVGRH
jgi:hypothetical protein